MRYYNVKVKFVYPIKFVCPICGSVKLYYKSYPYHGTRVCEECWTTKPDRWQDYDDALNER